VIRTLALASAAALMFSAAVPAIAQPAPAVTSTHDFVTAAAQSDEFERRAGHMAETMARSPRVKAFGARMVRDHTTTTRNLKAALRKAGKPIPPPPMLSPDQQQMLGQLKGSGAGFDATYLQQQVQAHQQALALLQGYAQGGDNPVIREAARNTLPLIRHHLMLAQQLQATVRH
jgi:putative membrane protein